MDARSQVRQVYRHYFEQADQVERKRNPMDGVLGFGSRPSSHPCNDQFVEELKEVLGGLTQAPSGEIYEALEYIYLEPAKHKDRPWVYWMLMAAHRLTVELIPCLTQKEANQLRRMYLKEYPRWDRTPAHKEVLSCLQRRSVQCGCQF